ncbi:MAG: YdeI/OmpD-associated family protein [Nitrospinae bacterium]|nr:YdeI/OmpD-associated family protein [Nitrospinota bacterium]
MKTKKGAKVPADLAMALKPKAGLLATFQRMKPSCQSEYVEWVESAIKPQTRAKRIASVIGKVSEWGSRHPAKPVAS